MLVMLTMPTKREGVVTAAFEWTADLEARLATLRALGLGWSEAALAMRLGRNMVAEKGRQMGLGTAAGQRPLVPAPEPPDRPAWPPGHPACWGLITAGTLLDGAPYPYPVFL